MHNIKSKLRYFFIGDVLLLTLVFGILNYNKFGKVIPAGKYLILFLTFIFFWASFSIYYDKYRIMVTRPYWFVLRIISWATLMCLLSITITVSFTDLWSTSRIFIILVTLIVFLIEIGLAAVITMFQPSFDLGEIIGTVDKTELLKNKYFFKWMIPGGISLIIIYIVTVWLVEGNFVYNPFNEKSLLILICTWGISTLVTNRYKAPNTLNHYYEIAPYIKATILMFLFLAFFYFFLRLEPYAGNLMFKTSMVFSSLEVFGFYLYFFGRSKKNGIGKIITIPSVNGSNGQENLKTTTSNHINDVYFSIQDLVHSLKDIRLSNRAKILHLLSKSLELEKIGKDKVAILNTSSTVNIQVLPNHSQDLLINFHDLNDFRRLNYYLLTSYKKLNNGSLLMGSFIPLEKFREHLRTQMPHFLFALIFPIHFIFHRVFPKLPVTKQIYFIITKGNNRIFSKAEIFGRLSFCGFEMVKDKMIGDRIYFICKKLKTVSLEDSPSYGPIVKLRRIGYQGKIISIYKFRTMHPYSEFLQAELYKKQGLRKDGDKIKSDFRLTNWGKVIRKYWIDELPQLLNWFRGDVTLVGVRALSQAKFDLYPIDLQKFRTKFIPGLIPPFYADLPNSFEGLLRSERMYLLQKIEKPMITDLKYFLRAFINIVFRGARSN